MSSVHSGLDARIFWKECVSLAEAGHKVHLVIEASDADLRVAGKLGVTVHPLPKVRSRASRVLGQAWRCYRQARRIDAGIYHFHDPELIPYGILLRMAGKRVFYDVHEDVPRDIRDKQWIPRWARGIVASVAVVVEDVGARWFFEIVAPTSRIAERFGPIARRTVEVRNYPIPSELESVRRESPSLRRQVCYVGSISRSRGLCVLVRALELLPDVSLVLAGTFADPALEGEVKALPGWKQVEYRGRLDRAGVRKVLGASMAGIVTLLPTPAFLDALPVKMFEYMSAGLPVVASDFPLWRPIVVGTGAGVCVDPGSPEAIARGVRFILDDPDASIRMGRAGRDAVRDRYNWAQEASKLIAAYGERG